MRCNGEVTRTDASGRKYQATVYKGTFGTAEVSYVKVNPICGGVDGIKIRVFDNHNLLVVYQTFSFAKYGRILEPDIERSSRTAYKAAQEWCDKGIW